jgi:hypothetical protein
MGCRISRLSLLVTVTLKRLTIQFKHDFLSYLAVQKISITVIAKQCSHVEFPYFVMGFNTLGANGTGHTSSF